MIVVVYSQAVGMMSTEGAAVPDNHHWWLKWLKSLSLIWFEYREIFLHANEFKLVPHAPIMTISYRTFSNWVCFYGCVWLNTKLKYKKRQFVVSQKSKTVVIPSISSFPSSVGLVSCSVNLNQMSAKLPFLHLNVQVWEVVKNPGYIINTCFICQW